VDVVREQLVVGRHRVTVARPADAAALIDETRFEEDEYLPYWAELWPAGVALARVVAGRDVRGLHVLEIGCGLGLPSIVAALGGASVVATDWSPDAVAAVRENAASNGARLSARVLDWRDRGGVAAVHDLVLAADVLYEARNAEPVAALVAAALGPRGSALVCDPGRRHAAGMVEHARGAGLAVEELPHDLPSPDARLLCLRPG